MLEVHTQGCAGEKALFPQEISHALGLTPVHASQPMGLLVSPLRMPVIKPSWSSFCRLTPPRDPCTPVPVSGEAQLRTDLGRSASYPYPARAFGLHH